MHSDGMTGQLRHGLGVFRSGMEIGQGGPRMASSFSFLFHLLTIPLFLPIFVRAFAHRAEGTKNPIHKKKRKKKRTKKVPKTGEDALDVFDLCEALWLDEARIRSGQASRKKGKGEGK